MCTSCKKIKVNIDGFQDIDVSPVGEVERDLVASLTNHISKYYRNCSCDSIHTMTKHIW